MQRLIAAAALALLAGCEDRLENGPTGNTKIADTCTSTDGIALEFTFGLESASCDAALSGDGWLRLGVWTAYWDSLAEGTYTFSWEDGEENGGAWYSADGVDWIGGGGWIEITDVTADGASGYYEITTDDGETLGASFEDAPYCAGSPNCG